jgi:hypothetical protein
MSINTKEKFIRAFMALFGSDSKAFFWSVCSFFILMFLFHVYKFLISSEPNWLGAYGALLTIYAVVYSLRHIAYPDFEQEIKPLVSLENGMWVQKPNNNFPSAEIVTEESAIRINDNHKEDMVNKYITSAFIYLLSVVGTLLWAYSFLIKI